MGLLDGKLAIITGASRGIGKSIAIKLAEHGADIAVSDIVDTEKSEPVVNEITALGVKAKAYQSDASSLEDSEKLIEAVINDFGKVDILVNNAGITRDNLLLRMSEDQFDDVIRINLKSAFNLTKAVMRHMMKARSGSIINMSSVVGVSGNAGQSNYSASKAGMIGFTKSIAQEVGSRNIRCNAIAPGFIETEMTASLDEKVVQSWRDAIPLRRGGTSEDVANATLFLASDLSAYITGQTLQVCGGMLT